MHRNTHAKTHDCAQAHHKRTTSTWRQPPPISHGWLVLCRLSVNSWNVRTHTNTNRHTCTTHTPRTERQVMDLKYEPLRLLDQFPYSPGFCNWPHSAPSSFLCTWLCELHKLMTANQIQMAAVVMLLLLLLVFARVREMLCFLCWEGNRFICCMFYKHSYN